MFVSITMCGNRLSVLFAYINSVLFEVKITANGFLLQM